MNETLKQEHIRYGKARFQGSELVEPFVNRIYQDLAELNELKTSCHGCKYDDSDVNEEERKAHCMPCLEPTTLRKNYTA